jgi:hypothetical protein
MRGGVLKASAKNKEPSFVEVRRPDALITGECVAWVEDSSGARLRLELRGLDAAQIGALARSFAGGSR